MQRKAVNKEHRTKITWDNPTVLIIALNVNVQDTPIQKTDIIRLDKKQVDWKWKNGERCTSKQ